ncbi:hypothetical protein P4K54_24405 [Bacillus cereus]|uniref:hypothetical protein n=1 Tax=Bacillus cereus TaxID=1396 RepID=UPI000BF52B09|nr:hypothetical protein [Bacillus cereus]MEB9822213.1 hypothetical protein [Bacillus cereus]MEB9827958.1 hypothetical protein [Bacillus cereus]PEY32594.1 hypothetical protein CN347_21215 [Bacillus cereus]PFQ65899.1 hypothetical protein COK18_07925 [Bacillus cereus]PGM15520.1 hypothetical protein CN935_00110 [Bacillus cereus]
MADYFCKDGKKYYKKKDKSCNSSNSNNCFIETFTIFGSETTPTSLEIPPGSTITLFENFTTNHNKTLIRFSFSPVFAAFVTLTIRTFNSTTPQTITLTPGDRKTFLFEDVQSITFSNATTANAELSPLFIQQTTCICCGESNSYYYESSDYGY